MVFGIPHVELVPSGGVWMAQGWMAQGRMAEGRMAQGWRAQGWMAEGQRVHTGPDGKRRLGKGLRDANPPYGDCCSVLAARP